MNNQNNPSNRNSYSNVAFESEENEGGDEHGDLCQVEPLRDEDDLSSRKSKKPKWDPFTTIPPNCDDESITSEWIKIVIQILKILTYVITFGLILCLTVTSKTITLLMSSMIQPNRSAEVCLDGNETYFIRYELNSVHQISWIWCLYFAIVAPYVLAFVKSLWKCLFKNCKTASLESIAIVFCMETLHSIGLCILMFIIFPSLDVIKCAMLMNSVCIIPALLRLLVDYSQNEHSNAKSNALFQIVSNNKQIIFWATFAIQFASIIVWTVICGLENINGFYLVPICLILVSLECWENYILPDKMKPWMCWFEKATKDLIDCRQVVLCFVMPWKVVLMFGVMLCCVTVQHDTDFTKSMFNNFTDAFHTNVTMVSPNDTANGEIVEYAFENTWWPLYLLIAHVLINYFCFFMAKFANKICIQKISFAIPICLTVPVAILVLWIFSLPTACKLKSFILPNEIYWYFATNSKYPWINYLSLVIWLLSWLSQFASATQLWNNITKRLKPTALLFVNPFYTSVLIDQSLAMNRRRVRIGLDKETLSKEAEHEEAEKSWAEICASEGIEEDGIDPKSDPESDETTRIYVCATMWHEDRNEMLQMLKAVMRLDFDQGTRRIARHLSDDKSQYYELEVNIFFDDAFEQGKSRDDDQDRVVNCFVEQLIDVMNEAASQVLATWNVTIQYPKVVSTPYGGKFIWNMPSGNRLIAHVKDKNLIRHRKRWSQCMYMYYLLGYRLAGRQDLTKARKRTIAKNTFVLALDGDINFQPSAVHMVVDLMRKDPKLGAACGRIHPIGSFNPIVLYQKFEYAIGHWFQKSTEHVFGCVLCSPGCFSLFRASALMDKSVIHKYTTKPSEALHYVQYDQGEDRWLCTLLLQQGWRIEYSAASDSYTHCPESFRDFFIQRRRWAPSTMANIIDLIWNFRQTVQKNENISLLYIIYQLVLQLCTIVTPGIIFLMVVAGMTTGAHFQFETSFYANLIPILMFVLVCLMCDGDNVKIMFAFVLSTIYALLMLAVLVGTAIDLISNAVLSPNAILFIGMMASFALAAILHPQEAHCVLCLPIYMLFIPSMYLLLSIYSVTNMHIVTWGTREVKSNLSEKELEALKAEQEAKVKAKPSNFILDSISKYFGNSKNALFNCSCCSTEVKQDQQNNELIIEMNDNINDLRAVINQIKGQLPAMRRPSVIQVPSNLGSISENDSTNLHEPLQRQHSINSFDSIDSLDDRPKWIRNNKKLKTFEYDTLPEREEQFWKYMIQEYLYPLVENPDEKQKIQNDLEELRNKTVFTFGFANVMVVLLVYLLEKHTDPNNSDKKVFNLQFYIGSLHVNMDPIGLSLVVCFGVILALQILGMIWHRFGTFVHLMAYTELDFFRKEKNETMANFVKTTFRMNKNKNLDRNSIATVLSDESRDNMSNRTSPRTYHRLDDVFDVNMKNLETDETQLSQLPSQIRGIAGQAIRRRSVFVASPSNESPSTSSSTNRRHVLLRPSSYYGQRKEKSPLQESHSLGTPLKPPRRMSKHTNQSNNRQRSSQQFSSQPPVQSEQINNLVNDESDEETERPKL